MRYVYIVLITVFICLVVIFAVQNRQTVTLCFLSWKMTLPLALQVLIVYILGMITGGSVFAFLKQTLKGVKKEQKPPEN
ncbi:DUF1049 domain-containing protein [candidate division WOR-3 bacterium]|nr:DUF1049 domain-containing protein [candidate division WOR-3 bacterium]